MSVPFLITCLGLCSSVGADSAVRVQALYLLLGLRQSAHKNITSAVDHMLFDFIKGLLSLVRLVWVIYYNWLSSLTCSSRRYQLKAPGITLTPSPIDTD